METCPKCGERGVLRWYPNGTAEVIHQAWREACWVEVEFCAFDPGERAAGFGLDRPPLVAGSEVWQIIRREREACST